MTVPRASFANGFAPRDGMPAYPSLWRGCIGAWNPGLGPTGLGLRDWSGYGNHGTITSTTADVAWTMLQGQHVLTFDGTGDYVATGFNPSRLLGTPAALACSASAWIQQSVTSTRQAIYAISGAPRWYFWIEATTRSIFVGIGSQGLNTASVAPASGLNHIGFTKIGGTIRVYINGRLDSTNTYTGDNAVPNLSIPLGAQDTGTSAVINGQFSDIMIWNRTLSDNEMRLLARRRGIAYELASVSAYAVQGGAAFRAAWALRQRLILGGGGGLG